VLVLRWSVRRTADLDDVDGFPEASAAGAVQVRGLAIYGSGEAVDPAMQVRAYAEATEQALADGYTGLRVAADATTLVRTPEARAAFARYEFLIDQFMTGNPLAAMCSYHVGELGHDTAAELAGMHPLAQPSATSLRLFASGEPGIAGVLAGEVDLSTRAHFQRTLDRADLIDVDGEITIDARDLAFIDHRALMHLVEHVRLRGATTVLHVGEHSVVRPLAALLRLPDLRVEVR
jgi:anti-anti-sigma regulatory factor